MTKEEISLDRKVDEKACDSLTKEEVFKGIYEGVDGKIRVTTGNGRKEQNSFVLEDVIANN